MRTATALLATILWLAWPAPAQSGCVPSLVIDGVRYLAQSGPKPAASGETVDVVFPACRDTGPTPVQTDARGEAQAIAGVPTAAAVLHDGDVYVAAGQLSFLAGHPVYSGPPTVRRDCLAGPTVSTRVQNGRARRVDFDAQTKLTNRPVTTPLYDGQRLRIDTVRCGGRLVADRVAFFGPDAQPERYEPIFEDEGAPWWPFALLVVLALSAGAIVLRR